MVTATQVEELRQLGSQLETVAFRDIKGLLAAVDQDNPERLRDDLLDPFWELIGPYVNASGELAATWYEDVRLQAPGVFYAEPVVDLDKERTDALVRYALAPLFGQSASTPLSLLAGGSQRLIGNASRATIISNSERDTAVEGYARIPRTGCCAFCAMLASRGAVYKSAASAGNTVGRGVDASETAGKRGGQGRGVKTRGSREIGSKFHDHCHCSIVPVYGDDPYPQEVQKHFDAIYIEASRGVSGAKDTLANMRAQFGLK